MFKQQVDQPAVHELMKELRNVVNEFEDRVLVGESDDLKFYGNGDDELHLVFNFSLMLTDRITPAWVRANQKKRLDALPNNAWPCNTLGNHDSSRMISKFGDGVNNRQLAEINLAMLLFLKGTPFLYNGEEIGMTDYLLDDARLFRDPLSTNIYIQETQMLKTTEKEAAALAARHGRDICRTPMQWSNAPNGGFCPPEITPWLPVNPNYSQGINVAEQEQALDSLLLAYKRLLAIRSMNPALVVGDYIPLLPDSRAVLAFLRTSVEQECLVLINYTSKIRKIQDDGIFSHK